MKKHHLSAEKRKTVGRKVKDLRKQGILPANIYGKDVKSLSIQLPFKDFEVAFKEAGETGLIELSVAGENTPRPVLVHSVQVNPVTSQPLHVDFFQVDLKQKVKAMVPLEIVSEAPAVKEKRGILLHSLSEVEVEALPTDLPEKIEVDVSSLSEVDQEIKVRDLKIPLASTLLADENALVAKIGPLVEAKVEEEMKKEEEEAAAAAAGGAEAGEAPSETGKEAGGEEKPTEAEKPTEGKPTPS